MRRSARAPRQWSECLSALALGACTLVLVTLATLASFATPAHAASEMTLRAQTPWSTLGATIALDLTIVDAPLDATVTATVHSAVTSLSAFDQTLDGDALGSVVAERSVPVGALAVIGSSERRLSLVLTDPAGGTDQGPDRIPITSPGVYPVEVRLDPNGADPNGADPNGADPNGADEDGADSFVTHIVVVDGDGTGPTVGERLGVAWVWPIDATPALTPEGRITPEGVAELEATGRVGRQVRALATAGIPVTVAPGGFTTEQWFGLELDTAADLLAVLAAPNQVLATGYVPLDLPSLLAAGLEDAAGVQRVAGTGALETGLDERVDIRTALARPVDAASFTRLTTAGVDRMVVSEDDLSPSTATLTSAAPFSLSSDGQTALAAAGDPDLEALLEGDDPPALRGQQFLAALSLVATEAPNRSRGVVVTNPPGWDPDEELLAQALGGLAGHPLLEPMTMDAFFDSVPAETEEGAASERTLEPRPVEEPPVDPDSYRAAQRDQDSFRWMAGPESLRLVPGDRALLVALAATWGPSSPEAARELDLVGTTLDGFVSEIRVPVGNSITLTARTGSIPLSFVNETGQDVSVQVSLESDKLDFPEGSTRQVVLPPRAHTERFEVKALTSGRFPLTLTVTAPDDHVQVATAEVDVRSTAVSGVGVFLTAGAGLVLAGWWANDIRKRRRRGTPRDGTET